jgi:hypothetical protein
MTLEEIVNNLKSAGQDYGQLFNNNPRMDSFASVLQKGVGQLIPSNADFKSPEAMRDWGTAAALNAPMGLSSLSNPAMNKIIKELEASNKSTVPKIPTGNVFNNSLGEIPLDTRLKADNYFSGTNQPQQINISDIVPTQKNITLNNLKGVNNIEDPVNAVMMNGKYYLTDGHHRASLANLNNEKSISANVFDGEKINPNLNFELLNKHLSGKGLTPEEMALYEANGAKMETPQLQRYNLDNANAQGGSPESRSKYLYDSFHGTPVLNQIGGELKIGGMHANRSNGAAYGEGIYSSNRPHTASTYSNYRQEPPGAGIIPLKIDKEDFLNLPALKESDKNLLGKYASNSMLPSERAYKMIGQERKEFKSLEDAREFFSQRQKDWEHFADGYDRAKPTASMENGTPIVDFINYNSDIPINTPHEAFSLMVNTGWDGVKELGYKGHTMHQGSGENWDVTNDTSKIRSRFAAFDPLRKNSSSLLASGLLGSLLLKQMNQESSQQ